MLVVKVIDGTLGVSYTKGVIGDLFMTSNSQGDAQNQVKLDANMHKWVDLELKKAPPLEEERWKKIQRLLLG
jgi:hypothetical protein